MDDRRGSLLLSSVQSWTAVRELWGFYIFQSSFLAILLQKETLSGCRGAHMASFQHRYVEEMLSEHFRLVSSIQQPELVNLRTRTLEMKDRRSSLDSGWILTAVLKQNFEQGSHNKANEEEQTAANEPSVELQENICTAHIRCPHDGNQPCMENQSGLMLR